MRLLLEVPDVRHRGDEVELQLRTEEVVVSC